MKFKVGDRVKYTEEAGDAEKKNEIGTLIYIKNTNDVDYLIEFDNFVDGHDGNFSYIKGKCGHCWWCEEKDLELIEPTKTSKKYYSQCDMVVDYINEFGSITSLDAFRELGATRLSGIIYNLKKQGYKIKSVDEGSLNRYGRMVYYARYSFEEEQ